MTDGSLRIMFAKSYLIDCPNPECNNQLKIRKDENDYGVTIRNCYECYARIQYDFDSEKVSGWEVVEPLKVYRKDVSENNTVSCPKCAWIVTVQEKENSKGVIVQYCPNCTNLLEIVDDQLANKANSADAKSRAAD